MEHVTRSMDFPVPGMQMRMVGHGLDNPGSLHFSVSKEQMGSVESIPTNAGFSTLMVSDNRVGHDESSGGILMSNQSGHEDADMNNVIQPKTSLPLKRKADMGPTSNGSISQESLLPNKRPANLGADSSSSGFLQPSASQRRTWLPQPNPSSPGIQAQSASNKEMAKNDSTSGKSGLPRGRPPKKQTTQTKSALKSQPESSEAVRSKMRESLAAALALASQKPDSVSNTEKDQNDATTQQNPMGSQASEFNSTMGGNASGSGSEGVRPSNESAVVGANNDCRVLSSEVPPNENSFNGGHTFQEFQYSSLLPDEDTQFSDNFFVKDDLLQGNGLSWALDFDMQKRQVKEAENADKPQSVKEEANGHRERGEAPTFTPENLAFKIEAELFKLFGGVNKKYKEKGRSLLFNLKDRNNPELRVRVMSGEISPERLCSMSAEELASKELAEWRTAKAEEMAQMVVLPDTEADVRRLVKKTHKGEYQVVFERDDGVAEEVSGGTSILTQSQSQKETKTHSPSKASSKDEEKVAVHENISGNQDFSGSLIIQTDGTDLMQGMMVDELKDTALLPPIVSLDEFMESLNSDPPFENLTAAALQKSPVSHEETPKVVNNCQASDQDSDSPKESSSKKVHVFKKNEANMAIKPSESREQKVLPSSASDVEYLWEGILQLNISSSVTVRGLFQSGEKTSTKEWLASIEIKGRVRLDSFEKFLQELPNSRTRAVMVLQFVLKDKSSENQVSDLSEAIGSYVADERLGYAEPAPGVELYLCPPTPRISEILKKYMQKEHLDPYNSNQNGLIGVVVWRRAHISNNISPNSSSHNKSTFKKQPNRFQDSSNVNVNVNASSRAPVSMSNNTQPEPEDDDDIPPGFGPVAAARSAKDEDDLPEFNFSGHGNPNPSVHRHSSQHGVKMTQRPVDEVRELIKKYGQSGTNVASGNQLDNRNLPLEPWDDDDDIPEWRPQAPHQVHHQPYMVVHGHRPPVSSLPANTYGGPMVNPQPSRGLAHPPHPGRSVQPPGPPHDVRWRLQ
ncbi:putative transcription factor DATF1 [Handroanthus impetiginosus]|uniref:Putative transcription factor DATF1 n=1 Tax=Handroanthus impetiginosus TaxID=429701 RepID=A0A2G9GUT8_9LAMI|nr:putative transcription factor DATF1 [Handroanthus impetiginosus]